MPNVPTRRRRVLALAILVSLLPATAMAATIAPSNLPAGFCSVPQTVDLVVSTNRQFNTADGGDCSEVVAQPGALDLCVVRQRAITIASGATVSVTGPRLLVLTASTNFTLQGTVDVSAAVSGGPAAGFNGAAGGASGGSNGTKGGDGGSGSTAGASAPNAPGGPALRPLITGSRGGASGSGGAGGSGGGAVQLVACGSFLLDTNASVRANGLGGLPGAGGAQQDNGRGGGGGGSGGSILIEGDTVDLVGRLVANGGGGGGGGSGGGFSSAGNNGSPGSAGGNTTTAATGGPGGTTTPNGGNGGSGGSLGAGSGGTNGSVSAFSAAGGGGGGGGSGRIRINGCTALMNNATPISPLATTGSSCDTLLANGFE